MKFLLSVYEMLLTQGPVIAGVLLGIVALAETIVRVTPTKKDDTAVERAGKFIRKMIDAVGSVLPNRKSGGGEHVKQVEKEKSEVAPDAEKEETEAV